MSPTWIEIDDEVLGQIKEKAEPFVDSPNDVLRGVFSLEAKRRPSCAPLPEAAAPRRDAPARSGRAPAGLCLPQSEYQPPILRALVALGGSGHCSQVAEMVESAIWERLTDLDKEPLQSGDVRWKNRLGFARMDAVKKGYLRGDSRRGIWELTEAGRQRAAELESPASSEGEERSAR